MIGRLIAKAVFVAIALGAAFFGTGLLGFALAHVLVQQLGVAAAYAVAGGVLLGVALIVLAIIVLSRPRKREVAKNDLTRVLLAAVAKETPWIAIVGAGLAGVANMFLNRNKSPK
jgi:NhaP-type Na+/H+ or K+/H+ antiporter